MTYLSGANMGVFTDFSMLCGSDVVLNFILSVIEHTFGIY